MAYKGIKWVNNETKLNAANLNTMDEGIKAAHNALDDLRKKVELENKELRDYINTSKVKFSFDSTNGVLTIV